MYFYRNLSNYAPELWNFQASKSECELVIVAHNLVRTSSYQRQEGLEESALVHLKKHLVSQSHPHNSARLRALNSAFIFKKQTNKQLESPSKETVCKRFHCIQSALNYLVMAAPTKTDNYLSQKKMHYRKLRANLIEFCKLERNFNKTNYEISNTT